RQREYLADARAVQWTRNRDGLGGVLRKILLQRQEGVVHRNVGGSVQHMLLVSTESGKMPHWLDSHPTLEQRIRRIYGRSMPAMPLERSDESPAPTEPGPESSPLAQNAPNWTLH
ncbi:MAG: M48 family metalloprotease, partial [Hydrogenophaga sp.]